MSAEGKTAVQRAYDRWLALETAEVPEDAKDPDAAVDANVDAANEAYRELMALESEGAEDVLCKALALKRVGAPWTAEYLTDYAVLALIQDLEGLARMEAARCERAR